MACTSSELHSHSWWDTHLPPLDSVYVRSFGAMVDETDSVAIPRFAISILQDMRAMFAQIPFMGDEGVPRVWFERPRYTDFYNLHTWLGHALALESSPSGIDLHGASLISAARHAALVPESKDCIKYAAWTAVRAVRDSPRWSTRKQRIRSKGAIEHIDYVLEGIATKQLRLVQSLTCKFIFYFEKVPAPPAMFAPISFGCGL